MAYHIEKTTSNGYRCLCCRHDSTSSNWVDTAEEALAEFPTEFPTEGEWSGEISRIVKDGTTGKVVAESTLTWPPAYTRGDGYTHTRWMAWIDEEAFPSRGTDTEQIIKGRKYKDELRSEPPEPVEFVTDRTWTEILDALKEKKRLWDIKQTEAQIADAQKKLAALTR